MAERLKMFRRTQEEIDRHIKDINEKLVRNSSQMSNLDRNGDTMDDTLLLGAKTERMLLEREMRELEKYKSGSVELISRPISKEVVSIGHSVCIAIKYPDGEEDNDAKVIIGGRLDRRFLNDNHDILAGSVELISEESGLSKAILGRKVGDEIIYQAHGGTGVVKILGIDDSLLTEK